MNPIEAFKEMKPTEKAVVLVIGGAVVALGLFILWQRMHGAKSTSNPQDLTGEIDLTDVNVNLDTVKAPKPTPKHKPHQPPCRLVKDKDNDRMVPGPGCPWDKDHDRHIMPPNKMPPNKTGTGGTGHGAVQNFGGGTPFGSAAFSAGYAGNQHLMHDLTSWDNRDDMIHGVRTPAGTTSVGGGVTAFRGNDLHGNAQRVWRAARPGVQLGVA